MGNQDQGFPLS